MLFLDLKFTKSYQLSRGSCHTITPLVSSNVFTQAGGYLFYLNFNASDIDEKKENGFEIFLHDPNEILTCKYYSVSQIKFSTEKFHLEKIPKTGRDLGVLSSNLTAEFTSHQDIDIF